MIDVSGISSAITEIQQRRDVLSGSKAGSTGNTENTFSAIFDQMVNLVGETDSLAAQAEAAEVNFTLGNADSIHEVTAAQQKALTSLQYTVAIKNALMDAYREIMNIQI